MSHYPRFPTSWYDDPAFLREVERLLAEMEAEDRQRERVQRIQDSLIKHAQRNAEAQAARHQ